MTQLKAFCSLSSRLLYSVVFVSSPVYAAESSKNAGPIGFADMRSALMPPPGLYAGGAFLRLQANSANYVSMGGVVPSDIGAIGGGVFISKVWDLDVFGGHISTTVLETITTFCVGFPTRGVSNRCSTGADQPYFEPIAWSRFFPSADFTPSVEGGPPPIPYGLATFFSFGFTPPIGQYSSTSIANNSTNFWVLAPSVAVTYTFKSLLPVGEATEISGRLFYDAYLKNPATNYWSGSPLDLDFAVTQRIGPFQGGFAGTMLHQLQNDYKDGVKVAPDGNRVNALLLGGVFSYDLILDNRPWTVGAKFLYTVRNQHSPEFGNFVVRFATKLY